ncbi:MAG: tetratricopeptide repeat protein [Thermodesulfobacteriota bacterium]
MDESSAFTKRHIEEVTTAKQTLLEELNLPPGVIAFLRANRVLLWAIFLAIIGGICGFRYYNYYTDNLRDNGAQALAQALDIQEEAARTTALKLVVADFDGSGAATWAKIAQAQDLAKGGELVQAQELLVDIFNGLQEGDPAYPLLLNGLGQLAEQQNELAAALSWYEKLLATPGFHAFGYIAAARVYEKMENLAKAKEMYENANTDTALQGEVKGWLASKIASL